MAPRPQLLTYPDSLGGDLPALERLLRGPLDGLFRGVHILPPYPSSGDRGFAPLTYDAIDPRFGDWDDIRRIGARHDVMLDLMVNHLSRRGPEFRDVERLGLASPSADLFLTPDRVWTDGPPPPDDLARVVRRRPGSPFSTFRVEATGEPLVVWTTFGATDPSEQIDLDVRRPATRDRIRRWLSTFAAAGVRIVRLDAVGYVIKRPGTSCFMVEPEIWDFLDWIAGEAAAVGLLVLPEIHDQYATHERLAERGLWSYDFVLPGLLLHTLETGDARRLAGHLARSPARVVTTLDCHDGIPVRPDLDGILAPAEMRALATGVKRRGGNVTRTHRADRSDPGDLDLHQLNVTYYDAVGRDDQRYLAARAIQLFARGVPQIYYVGLLAGVNDTDAVRRVGDGRAINRHDYGQDEIVAALERPVVRRLVDLIRLRATHPAFDGALSVDAPEPGHLRLGWAAGAARCVLDVDLTGGAVAITVDGVRTST